MPYDIGDAIRLQGVFQDTSGAYIDPTVVHLKIRKPDGTLTDWIYGVAADIEKPSVGTYYAVVIPTMEGLHWYRFTGSGSYAAAEERAFYVNPARA